jgi:hypothetical protein
VKVLGPGTVLASEQRYGIGGVMATTIVVSASERFK